MEISEKKLLVVIDMQNDFIDGALGTKEAREIVSRAADKIAEHKGPIFYTMDTHTEEYLNSAEGRKLPVKHCIKGSEGWKLNDRIKEAIEHSESFPDWTREFEKPTFGSVTMAKELKEFVEEEIVDSVEIIGLCTDICVISNALLLKAYYPELMIAVDESCCAGVSYETHKNAIEAMRQCQIDIL